MIVALLLGAGLTLGQPSLGPSPGAPGGGRERGTGNAPMALPSWVPYAQRYGDRASRSSPMAGTGEAEGTETSDTEQVVAPLMPAPTPPPPAAAPAPPAAAAAAPIPALAATAPYRWFLMRELQGTAWGALLDDNRLFITGWLQQSYTASNTTESNQPLVWNDRANAYLFQQAWLRVGRSLVTSGTTEPSFGFQVDVLTGSDYRFTLPRGLFNSQLVNSDGAQNLYGVDPIQHYVSAYVPTLFAGTEFRLGRLYTPWGVESLEGISNPLLSRSYAFNWCPPFTHCGGGAYMTFNPEWSAVALLVNGNDVYFGDPSEEMRFVGNVKWTQPGGGRNTLTLAASLGRGKFNPNAATPPSQNTVGLAFEPLGRNNFNAIDLVYTHTFSPVLSYSTEIIYGYQYNVPDQLPVALGPHGFADWLSAAHYLFYTLGPNWGTVLRYENFEDFMGQRTGFAGLYTAVTAGVQYRVARGVILRPEVRYDYNSTSRPFEGKHDIFTVASDLIIRW